MPLTALLLLLCNCLSKVCQISLTLEFLKKNAALLIVCRDFFFACRPGVFGDSNDRQCRISGLPNMTLNKYNDERIHRFYQGTFKFL